MSLSSELSHRHAVFLQEMTIKRQWSASEHPEWLIFEMEGQLQIRPEQSFIAQHLIDNPGSIAQLNMGLGKTQVILPLLILHWTRKDLSGSRSKLVRINLLSTLIDEAHASMAQCLTASVLMRKIFTLPFCRDVEITTGRAHAMISSLKHCQASGGAVLVAPEQRMSLHLKIHELADKENAEVANLLHGLETGLPFIDVLDESDELLNHRFQLVYAIERAKPLPSLVERSMAVQVALRAVSRLADGEKSILSDPRISQRRSKADVFRPPGAFCGLRLLPGSTLDEALTAKGELLASIVDSVINHLSYDLFWIRNVSQGLQNKIKRVLLDESTSALQLLDGHLLFSTSSLPSGPPSTRLSSDLLDASQIDQILALRGLLVGGILVHGLKGRHLVEYGVNRLPSALKRMAVPFRGSQMPSERSEFAQPDVAILLTTLSYYHEGLKETEMLEALRQLLKLGINAQRDVYNDWLSLAQGHPNFHTTWERLTFGFTPASFRLTLSSTLQGLQPTAGISHRTQAEVLW